MGNSKRQVCKSIASLCLKQKSKIKWLSIQFLTSWQFSQHKSKAKHNNYGLKATAAFPSLSIHEYLFWAPLIHSNIRTIKHTLIQLSIPFFFSMLNIVRARTVVLNFSNTLRHVQHLNNFYWIFSSTFLAIWIYRKDFTDDSHMYHHMYHMHCAIFACKG